MATMIAELYDALIKAGADDASARSAAVAVADYDRRLADGGARVEAASITRSKARGRRGTQ
jgi:hypothetical protein